MRRDRCSQMWFWLQPDRVGPGRPGGPDSTDSFMTDLATAIIKLMKSCEGTLSHSCSADANMLANAAARCYQPFQRGLAGIVGQIDRVTDGSC